ncbi:hypothetical protein [Candidatus Roseilinea sp. NK_OTU-006]|jgi:hypothetical protein|uniref:hypothetical protein n=1 Tax=Candidatus Roseilinea sp. NK_OTU-006 TaxID=2704250 RepID=UPI00145EC6C3|nr:hypothetical protein [Candidatus Roseilinea sp. NK_OTU-006]
MTRPSQTSPHHLRPALRVGVTAGLTLALAAIAQQAPSSPGMRALGTFIIMMGFGVAGYFAARRSGVLHRNAGYSVGALSGLIAGLCVSCAFVVASLLQSFDPASVERLQAEVAQQLSPLQVQQMEAANIDLGTLTQFSLALSIACCGLGFPIAGLTLGALGGASGAMRNHRA